MNFHEELTIVIPTYNRSKYLKRSLYYWGQTEFMVIVADGSEKKFDGKIPPNVSYYFNSQVNAIQRWLLALQKVRTRYVALCADDDFLSVRGIHACVAFLESHPDYVSAQGHAIDFTPRGKNHIYIEAINAFSIGYKIDGDTAAERLEQLFDEYIHQTFSVYRTPMLQLAFETCKTSKNINYMELGTAIVPSIFGRHKVLPVFYSARENLPVSLRGTTEAPRFDILKPEGLTDYAQWRDKIARIYSDAEGVSLDVALSIIEQTFDKYCAWDLRTFPNSRPLHVGGDSAPTGFSARNLLKRIIPPALLEARRKVLRRLRNGVKTTDAWPNSPGFPWSDPAAAEDWQYMVNVIKKHI